MATEVFLQTSVVSSLMPVPSLAATEGLIQTSVVPPHVPIRNPVVGIVASMLGALFISVSFVIIIILILLFTAR